MHLPAGLVASAGRTAERRAWLAALPELVRELADQWTLDLGEPFDGPEVSAAWVAPATGADGSAVVLKIGMPHMEARDEIAGLRFWNGDPTVRVLEADVERYAIVLERCEPGSRLRERPEDEQDEVIAGLLRRLWRAPEEPHAFRPLAEMASYWVAEARQRARMQPPPDWALLDHGLRLFEELATESTARVLLATDLHAGNVLRSTREPWLVIDPKPFVGDPAYDATQHLFNCEERLQADPLGLIARFAGLLEVDPERVRSWMYARAVVESFDADMFALANALA